MDFLINDDRNNLSENDFNNFNNFVINNYGINKITLIKNGYRQSGRTILLLNIIKQIKKDKRKQIIWLVKNNREIENLKYRFGSFFKEKCQFIGKKDRNYDCDILIDNIIEINFEIFKKNYNFFNYNIKHYEYDSYIFIDDFNNNYEESILSFFIFNFHNKNNFFVIYTNDTLSKYLNYFDGRKIKYNLFDINNFEQLIILNNLKKLKNNI